MDSLRSASDALAAARRLAANKDEAAAAAQASYDAVHKRLLAIDNEAADITAKRRAGQAGDEVGARLALLEIDRGDLLDLLKEPAAELTAARQAATAAQVNVDHAMGRLLWTKDEVALADRIAYADEMDSKFRLLLGEMAVLSKRLGHSRQPWSPTQILSDSLRKLDLNRPRQ